MPYADERSFGQYPDRPLQQRPCWPSPVSRQVAGSLASAPHEAALTLRPPSHDAGGALRRCPAQNRLHRFLARTALLAQASDAVRPASSWRRTLLLVRSFVRGSAAPYYDLGCPLAPAQRRHPFRCNARSPQVRTHSFTARPPNLRHRPLVTRASRLYARSPWSLAPSIRFLFIGPQLRSTLPPHGRSPFRSCASLRSL